MYIKTLSGTVRIEAGLVYVGPQGMAVGLVNKVGPKMGKQVKHGVAKTFKAYQHEVDNQLGKTIKALRSDQAGYALKSFARILKGENLYEDMVLPCRTWCLALAPDKRVSNVVRLLRRLKRSIARRRKYLQKSGGCFGLAQQAGSAGAVNQQYRLRSIMPKSTDVDHHDNAFYIPVYYRTRGFTGEEREVNKSLINRLFHKGRVVLPNFLEDEPNLRNIFAAIGFDCLLDIDEQICPVFVLQFYKSVRIIEISMELSPFLSSSTMSKPLSLSKTLLKFSKFLVKVCVYTSEWPISSLSRHCDPHPNLYLTKIQP
ncbi:hypothetical protein Tco_0805379 [Tanacetum coccineum]